MEESGSRDVGNSDLFYHWKQKVEIEIVIYLETRQGVLLDFCLCEVKMKREVNTDSAVCHELLVDVFPSAAFRKIR